MPRDKSLGSMRDQGDKNLDWWNKEQSQLSGSSWDVESQISSENFLVWISTCLYYQAQQCIAM